MGQKVNRATYSYIFSLPSIPYWLPFLCMNCQMVLLHLETLQLGPLYSSRALYIIRMLTHYDIN